MSQYQIAVVVGSLRKDSYNRALAGALAKLAPPEFTFRQVEIGDLPLYNPDLDGDTPPTAWAKFRSEIVGAEGVLTDGKPLMGSEDFADMLRVVPGAYAWVGHAGTVPVHNPAYVLDDGILPVGASLLARLVETRAAA